MTSTIQQFHRLAATAAPRLNVSVSRTETLVTTATSSHLITSYTIKGQNAELPRPVEVTTQTSEVDAINQFSKAKAQAYRVKDTDRIISSLQADWTQEQLDGMRAELLTVHYYKFADKEAAIRKADQERYDALMHQDYEQTGGYDEE